MTPPQEHPGRRYFPRKPPDFPLNVGAACRPPAQFYLAVNARCCIRVPAPCRAGSYPAVQIYLAHNVPVCHHIPRAAYTPPLQATGLCAANTKTTPAKLRRGGVKTPPYGFTEIANKIVNTNSRQVVGAACRPPVQFYLAVNRLLLHQPTLVL